MGLEKTRKTRRLYDVGFSFSFQPTFARVRVRVFTYSQCPRCGVDRDRSAINYSTVDAVLARIMPGRPSPADIDSTAGRPQTAVYEHVKNRSSSSLRSQTYVSATARGRVTYVFLPRAERSDIIIERPDVGSHRFRRPVRENRKQSRFRKPPEKGMAMVELCRFLIRFRKRCRSTYERASIDRRP